MKVLRSTLLKRTHRVAAADRGSVCREFPGGQRGAVVLHQPRGAGEM